VTVSSDTTAKVWHANTGQLLLDLTDHTWAGLAASFSPDGSRVVTASYDGAVKIWHADTGQVGMMLTIAKERLARLLPPEEFAVIFDVPRCTPD